MGDELPIIACHAALALDNILIENGPDMADIERLVNWLSEAIGAEIYPHRILTLWKTLLETGNTAKMRVTDDVVRETRLIVDALKAAHPGTDPDELKRLRGYCLALSQRASVERSCKRGGWF